MSVKEIDVTCPCCNSRISVDVRTQKIVRWLREEQLDEAGKPKVDESDWSSALGRVEGRQGRAEDKFDQALGKERSRARDLDELFRRSHEKLRDEEE